MNPRLYLLDTSVLIWALEDNSRLSKDYLSIIRNGEQCWVSIVSLWEIAIKTSIGKLKVRNDILDVLSDGNIEILSIDVRHIDTYKTLPLHHRDPFDRMLIAQAMTENLSLLTVDRNFPLYGVAIA